MKSVDAMKARLGSNMRESMGVERPVSPNIPAPRLEAGSAGKYDRTAGLKRALAVPVDRITPDPAQPRKEFDEEALAGLAESLKARGQLQPIRVRWDEPSGRWVIVSGERRWRAAALAGLPTLQCVEAKDGMTPDQLLEDQLIENCLREDLKPVEQAHAFRALMEGRGLTYRQLAGQLHISAGAVSQALALLKLPAEVQSRVESGDLAATVAYELSKVDDPAEQAALASRVVTEGLSRSETIEAIRQSPGQSKTKGRGVAKSRKLTSRVFRTPTAKVSVELRKGAGAEAMACALRDALSQAEAALNAANND